MSQHDSPLSAVSVLGAGAVVDRRAAKLAAERGHEGRHSIRTRYNYEFCNFAIFVDFSQSDFWAKGET